MVDLLILQDYTNQTKPQCEQLQSTNKLGPNIEGVYGLNGCI